MYERRALYYDRYVQMTIAKRESCGNLLKLEYNLFSSFVQCKGHEPLCCHYGACELMVISA